MIGGGFSGTLQAIHLLRLGARVTLIERAPRLGRGVAYSTPHPDHLLNVRASGMSAWPDRPGHFAEWLRREGRGDGDSFAERRLYGRYLEELLAAAAAEAGDRLRRLAGQAVSVVRRGEGETVGLEGGASIEADAAILAIGNLAPGVPRAMGSLPPAVYQGDPWASDVAAGLGSGDTVLLIGTGLTAVDAALMLDAAGFGGRIVAMSRRGLVPRAHAAPAAVEGLSAAPPARCGALLRAVRGQAGELGWRAAVDRLRPVTQALWASASTAERRRFLRHLRPWWDVHRHRIAPEIAARIEAMQAAGRLRVHAGKIVAAAADGAQAAVTWRRRGSAATETLRVARIVNCTGPQGDVARAGEPLLDELAGLGRIRPDSCRIGIDVDAECRVLDAAGTASDTLFAVGPITRGAFWEIVAVPDIRGQVAALAQRLARPGLL